MQFFLQKPLRRLCRQNPDNRSYQNVRRKVYPQIQTRKSNQRRQHIRRRSPSAVNGINRRCRRKGCRGVSGRKGIISQLRTRISYPSRSYGRVRATKGFSRRLQITILNARESNTSSPRLLHFRPFTPSSRSTMPIPIQSIPLFAREEIKIIILSITGPAKVSRIQSKSCPSISKSRSISKPPFPSSYHIVALSVNGCKRKTEGGVPSVFLSTHQIFILYFPLLLF